MSGRGRWLQLRSPPTPSARACWLPPPYWLVLPGCSHPIWESPFSQCDLLVLFPSILAALVLKPCEGVSSAVASVEPGITAHVLSQVHLKDQTAAAECTNEVIHEHRAVRWKNTSPFLLRCVLFLKISTFVIK